MTEIHVATQEELDAALTQEGARILCVGSGLFDVRDSATVRAGDSATVHAWDSATVHAWDSATVRAGDSATVRAWDSATVHAGDSATVHAWGSATVRAWKRVAVYQHSPRTAIEGGVLIDTRIQTPLEWCEANLVPIQDGVATLYKALKEDYRSPHGVLYTPGSQPEAPDWDGGEAECGGGLRFSPQPFLALSFYPEAVRFVACPVALEDMVVHPEPRYPGKIKARRVCGPVVEVDLDGNPIEQEESR